MKNIKHNFIEHLTSEVSHLAQAIATEQGDWIVKGFIDVHENIYTISIDTKIVSKIIELLIFPQLVHFAQKYNYEVVLSKEQNFYPDITFIDRDGNKFAVDIKSTYRKDEKRVNGMTLGAFTGYFRDRKSTKNTTYAYDDYVGHFVLGLIYTRSEDVVDERKVYHLSELSSINSVIENFQFFVQEKYKIAIDRPGSGNTKNIGGEANIERLIKGEGPFSELGEKVFNDYWQHYLTKDMAKAAELEKPFYTNLRDYKTFRKID